MDADFKEKRRARISSKRWSMNSQRLEEIVAELMRPVGDLRRCFDTDLSALLEEYLTEAGLHALEAGEGDDGEEAGGAVAVPNFAELALLLQQSASLYGRKVDFLYQHVLSVSDALHNTSMEISNPHPGREEEEAGTPGRARRRRRTSACEQFAHVSLEASGGAAREAGRARPPPTLPRAHVELAPRAPPHTHPALAHLAALADCHVLWRIQDGLLVSELGGESAGCGASLRPIPLPELQAAIEAAAPPPLPPLARCDSPPPPDHMDTPPASPPPLAASTPLPPPPAPAPPACKRRRTHNNMEHLTAIGAKMVITTEFGVWADERREFEVPLSWRSRTLSARRARLLALRHTLRHDHTQHQHPVHAEFRGFEFSSMDVDGFRGFSTLETSLAVEAAAAAGAVNTTPAGWRADSEDDGFFEQSPLSTPPRSLDESAPHAAPHAAAVAWAARVAAHAESTEHSVDVRELGSRVCAALPPAPACAPWPALLASTVRRPQEVSHIFLATLFLANAGCVEVLPGAPRSLDSFSVRAAPPGGASVADLPALPAPAPAHPPPPR